MRGLLFTILALVFLFFSVAKAQLVADAPTFSQSAVNAVAPEVVSFSALAMDAGLFGAKEYYWDFGDGSKDKGSIVTHVYGKPGVFNIRLVVVAGNGVKKFYSKYINVKQNKDPQANFTTSFLKSWGRNKVQFDAGRSQDPDGSIVEYNWNLGDGSNTTGKQVEHRYSKPGLYEVTLSVQDNKGGRSTVKRTVAFALDPQIKLKSLGVLSGVAPFMVALDAEGSGDPAGQALTYRWDFGDGGRYVGGAQSTYLFKKPGRYTVTVTGVSPQGAEASKEINVNVLEASVPVLPFQLQRGNASELSLLERMKLLYQGSESIQSMSDVSSIREDRISVVFGRVLNEDGEPLSGVRISRLGKPEEGFTHSREDGRFDLVVNGDSSVVVDYQRNGYIQSQRRVKVGIHDFFSAPDVALVKHDDQVTLVQKNDLNAKVITASKSVDKSGARRAFAIIPANTQAQMVRPDGLRILANQMSYRITEFTVGELGPNRMPGELPPFIAYTYAANFTSDEAIAVGAKAIEFSTPVAVYVDNFLNFDVGRGIPLGTYDTEKGVWVPEQDGMILRVLDTKNGRATLDVDGSGRAATAIQLKRYGFDDSELQALAANAQPGQSLWRGRLTTASSYDLNALPDQTDNMIDPPSETTTNEPPDVPGPCKKINEKKGLCVVDLKQQTLRETVDLVGVPFSLNYSTGRAPGRTSERKITIPLFASEVFEDVDELEIKISVAGQIQTIIATPSSHPALFVPYAVYNYQWNGLDGFGNPVNGTAVGSVSVSYWFPGTYSLPGFPENNRTFSNVFPDLVFTSVASRGKSSITRTNRLNLGLNKDNLKEGLGGWTFSVHHRWDPLSKNLMLGTGQVVNVDRFEKMGYTTAGTGSAGFSGDSGLAQNASLNNPVSIVKDSLGNQYISDQSNNRVRKIDTSGVITTIAGGGLDTSSTVADATDAKLESPGGLAVSSDDLYLYIPEIAKHRVRQLDLTTGALTTIAGTGTSGFAGDTGLATAAQLSSPRAVIIAAAGGMYIADSGNRRVRKIDSGGFISTFAGTGTNGFEPNFATGRLSVSANIGAIYGLAEGATGEVYLADFENNAVLVVQPGGQLYTYAGRGTTPPSPAPGKDPAGNVELPEAVFSGPVSVSVTDNGEVYVVDKGHNKIRRIDPAGYVITLAGTGMAAYNGDNHMAAGMALKSPSAVLVRTDGSYAIADSSNNRLRLVSNNPASNVNTIDIPAQDGSEIYRFDITGKHLKTIRATTGTDKYTFQYEATGNKALISITDAFGNVTSVTPACVEGPYGQKTYYTLNSLGYLNTLINPSGEIHRIEYDSGGLMTKFVKPKGNYSRYEYNGVGELTKDIDAADSEFTFALSRDHKSLVTATSPEGRTYSVDYFRDMEAAKFTRTSEDGRAVSIQKFKETPMYTVSTPDSEQTTTYAADPRWGAFVYYNDSTEITDTGITKTAVKKELLAIDDSNFFNFQSKSTVTRGNFSAITSYLSSTKTYTTTTGLGLVSKLKIDNYERPVETQLASFYPTTYGYDSAGRLTSLTQNTRVTAFTYNALGQISTVTDPELRVYTMYYDLAGRVSRVLLPDGVRDIQYVYDKNGNQTRVTPYNRGNHLMNFSVLDLMSTYESPDVGGNVGRIEYVRNLDSDLTKVIRPNLDEVKYTYNSKQQVTKLEIPGMTVDYVYDINTQTLVEADNGAVNIIYNSAGGRPSLKMYTIGLGSISLQWNYDTLNGTGLMKEFVFDGDEIDYGYNSDLLLTSVGNLSIARTPTTGLVSGTTLGVVTDAYTYSSYAELATHESKAGATVLLSNTFTRDNLGRITQKVENNSGTTTTYVYGYDLLGRLETTSKNGSAWSSYVYDHHSNRVSATINGVTEASTYDAQDRLTSRGVWTYAYNDNGELATKTNTTTSETTTYTYNALGQLLSVALPGSGGTITYGMDAENKRFSRSDSVTPSANRLYLHDANGRVTAMLNGSGVPMQIYLYGTQSHSPDYMINSSFQMFRFVKDHLGSVRKVVRNNGTVVQNIDYDEFGRVTNDSNPGYQPFGYAGGVYDYRTGLVRFGARDYDSEVGRWTSKDPILFAGGDSNLYQYVKSDPINSLDPTGLVIIDSEGIVPEWIKNTPIYRELDSALAVIVIGDKDLTDVGKFGFNYSVFYGRYQRIDIDLAASSGWSSQICTDLSGVEDSILHELNHARLNLSRLKPVEADENKDNKLLKALFVESIQYKH